MLIYWHFATKIYEWWQQKKVQRKFYCDPVFKELDQKLLAGENPFRIPEAFPYGETPLYSLHQMATRCGLSSQDRFVDLGCGRGRGVVFLTHFFWVPGIWRRQDIELYSHSEKSPSSTSGVFGRRFAAV